MKENRDWTKVEERNSYNLVYSEKLNLFAEQYQISVPSANLRRDWLKRMDLKGEEIVQIIDYQVVDSQKHHQLTSNLSIKFYLEVISFRLSEIIQTEFDYEQQWLIQCLKGFQKLFKEYGYFRIKASMIGITPSHKAKVWINPNFLSNSKLQGHQTETSMVISIINLFKKVNILIPEQNVTFKRMIQFMQNKTLTRSRSRSDIIFIQKLQFKDKNKESFIVSCSQTKSSFSDIQKVHPVRSTLKMMPKIDVHLKQSSLMKIQIPAISRFAATEADIISKILNPSIKYQKKIVLIDEIINQNINTPLRKLCQVYKYCILHNEQQLLNQLQQVNGRLSNIKKGVHLQKIAQILGQNREQLCNRSQIAPSRINQILCNQRAKRSKQQSTESRSKSIKNPSITELKQESQKLLFD